ncbi:MAG: AraC family transcriptional regulator [Zoogloeaceae bacterium]|jgi:AraC-like DNA-binding protein|nr:AraC family transcriptional regulator [Zoogloeaceae bacterium]
MIEPQRAAPDIQMDAFLAGSPTGVPEPWRDALRVHGLPGGGGISCFDGNRLRPWAFHSEGAPAFSLCVLLEGRMHTTLEGGRPLDLRKGMLAFMLSGQATRGENVLGGGRFRMVDFHLAPRTLRALAGPHLAALQGCLAHDCSIPEQEMILGSLPASSTLQRAACDILSCDYPRGHIRDLYLEAKTREALAALLNERVRLHRPHPLPVPADRRRLLEARGLLERHFDEDWTVRTLAHTVGLNEKRLQAGFRALFSQTFHACLTDIRMQAAARMLERGRSVTDAALGVGYASLGHFSKAFRQHMGICPKRWAMERAIGA